MAGDIQYFEPQGMAPPGGHYSHAVKHGDLVFLSGQLPIASDGTLLVDKDFATQLRQVLANLGTALHAAGGSVAKLVQVRVYIVDIIDWPLFDRLYSEWIGAYGRLAQSFPCLPSITDSALKLKLWPPSATQLGLAAILI